MLRLSALRRFAACRSSVQRSPEASGGLVLDQRSHFVVQNCSFDTVVRRVSGSSHPLPYFRSFPVFSRQIGNGVLYLRQYSSMDERDDIGLDEEVERNVGWLFKGIFIVTAVGVAFQFFPYMGENLLIQSISLMHVKDPLFKRMGASRVRRFAIDDERRMKVVNMGGAQDLLIMLEGAKDDKTRKEALNTLLTLSHSDEAAEMLQQAGASVLVAAVPDSSTFTEIGNFKDSLLNRLREFEHDPSPS